MLHWEKLSVPPNSSYRTVPQPILKPITYLVIDDVKGAEASVANISQLRGVFGTTISTYEP